MFAEYSQLQELFASSRTTEGFFCSGANDDWDGVFTVNYNVDEEPVFDDDVNSSTYGNYRSLLPSRQVLPGFLLLQLICVRS